MASQNHPKLLDAGFTIIRDEARHISGIKYKCRIYAKTPARREWHTLEKDFKSVKQMSDRKTILLQDPKTIED
jgi:hypothetical protein